jgi:hypothetical protein
MMETYGHDRVGFSWDTTRPDRPEKARPAVEFA